MSKNKKNTSKRPPSSDGASSQRQIGSLSRTAGRTLVSYNLGALPILEQTIERANLPEFLRRFVLEDKRCKISPVLGIVVLVKNYLASREPIYGVNEWAGRHLPDALGLSASQIQSMNDDRVGRCLDRLFEADCPGLALAITRHVVEEFGVDLSELHNDSTTITFTGAYEASAETKAKVRGKKPPAITWGHNKDHRPDLKQLLYNLTVTSDGAVPVAFGIEDGNVTDDQTHQATWDLLCRLIGSADFLYVADSKLATRPNMTHIVNRGGRFLTVLPRTRKEDRNFRERLLEGHDVKWERIYEKPREEHEKHKPSADIVSVADGFAMTTEGYRLVWYHSTRKAELDRIARVNCIRRASARLSVLRLKLMSPRTRYNTQEKVQAALDKVLAEEEAASWLQVHVKPLERPQYVKDTPGRPGPDSRYRKETKPRFDFRWVEDTDSIERAERADGVFPLVTNERRFEAKELLLAYRRQAHIEKRFSQLKTQFTIAPVFLKRPERVVALLTIYYFALVVQALIERELRRAMKAQGIESLPLYHEDRECKAPTTRRVIDVFENIQVHDLTNPGSKSIVRFTTELSDLQREILRLLGVKEERFDF